MGWSFRTKLLVSHGVIAMTCAVVVAGVMELSLGPKIESTIDRRLETQARAVARWIERARHYDRLAGRLAGVVDARVTLIDADGTVLGDSVLGENVSTATLNLSALPEVESAQKGAVGRATRFSADENEVIRYLTVPGPRSMVVRLGVPAAVIADARGVLRPRLIVAATVSLGIALLLAGYLSRALSLRVARMREIAEQIGRGDYNVPPPSQAMDEFGVLSRTMAMSADKLRRLDEMRREFLANAAHELRTPVASIRGFAETLKDADDEAVDATTRREFAETIYRNSLRISRLVDALLQLQSFENQEKRKERPRVAVALAPVMTSVTRTLANIAKDTSANIVVDVAEGVFVSAYEDELEQVLTNLVHNALKYGGDAVEVRVTAEEKAKRVAISVSDNGPGIPAEALPRVFERFYRVQKGRARKQGGSGLGLAIVKEFVEAMAGTVEVTSGDAGTTFTVTLDVGVPDRAD